MVKKNVFSWKVFFLKYLSKKNPLCENEFLCIPFTLLCQKSGRILPDIAKTWKMVKKYAEIKDGWINSIWVNTRQENYMASIFLKYFVFQMFKVKAS